MGPSDPQRAEMLVVEDEWLIADHLQLLVENCGFVVVGPVPTVGNALDLLARSEPCAALLDVTLGPERSYPVAAALRERGVPFILLTGYTHTDLPADLGEAALLNKPIKDAELCTALKNIISARRS